MNPGNRPNVGPVPTPTVDQFYQDLLAFEDATDDGLPTGPPALKALTDAITIFRDPVVNLQPALQPTIDALLAAIAALGKPIPAPGN